MIVRSHFAVVIVILTGVAGGIFPLLAPREPASFLGDDHGELLGEDGEVPTENAPNRTGDDIISYLRCNIDKHDALVSKDTPH